MNEKYIIIYEVPATFLPKSIQYEECDTKEEVTEKIKELIKRGAINVKAAKEISFEVNVELMR